MKIHACYTPAHEVLWRDYFVPSIPAGCAVQGDVLDIEGQGDFLSREFLQCIRQKISLVLKSLDEEKVVVWSDVDIFSPAKAGRNG